jgi:hypothetical protein
MRHLITLQLPATILALTLMGSPLSAQAKKPSKPKPPASKSAKPPPQPKLGTKQMAGEEGVLGTEYTLGKDSPMNITVNKVEYRGDRIRTGDDASAPNAEEKFLVVHFTFHNPVPRESLVRGDTFRFTAVDAAGTNHDYVPTIWQEATGAVLEITLKPGQRMDGYAIIHLPAAGDIEKLMILSPESRAIRYPLKGKVKPLLAPYSDPSEKGGFTMSATLPAKTGEALTLAPTGHTGNDSCDFTIEQLAFSSMPILEEEPEEGKQFVIVTARVKNTSQTDGLLFRFDSIKLSLNTTEGESIEHNKMLHATQDRELELTLARGAEGRFRLRFSVQKDAKFKTLTIKRNDNDRPFSIDLSKGL